MPSRADKVDVEISSIALSGVEAASASFEKAAAKVASAASPAADSVDLSAAAVQMLNSRNDFTANLQTLHVANEMERQAIDLLF